MPFSESIKNKVKENSNFQCCKCQSMFIDVHHIVPESEGGSNDIDNAVPLCPNCHRWYGGNSDLRKAIISMRNFHYENCKNQKLDIELLKKTHENLIDIQKTQQNILDSQEKNFEKISVEMKRVSESVTERFDEIMKKAKGGGYPDSTTFSNDVFSTSGTASVIFGNVLQRQEEIQKPDFVASSPFSVASSSFSIDTNTGKFVRCSCGNFIEVRDFSFSFLNSNQVQCPKCRNFVRF
jgi:DNA gyrase/topoisomerase IV subunit A